MTAKNNRRKGCQYERDLARLFREMGWVNCETSRYASKKLDDLKVDLTETFPFQVQAKSVQRLSSPHAILKSMPKIEGTYNVIFNKKLREGEVVIISKDHFIEMIQLMIQSGAITPKC